MDDILRKCVEIAEELHKEHNSFGLVAASLVDGNNPPIYAASKITISGKWKHAERCVIEEYISLYKVIPNNAILVTTLAPCFVSMGDRIGSSCDDLIQKHQIKTVYVGCIDYTQHKEDESHKYSYLLKETKDEELKSRCKNLLKKISKVQDID